ncbi:MAG: GTPase HflX [Chromatiales bacterium]|nr:GTPase HflX [Chromatiales bacterium]
MFERPGSGERAYLVHVRFGRDADDDEGAELAELARSAGAELVGARSFSRPQPDPKTLIGRGQVEIIAAEKAATDAELVIVDHELSPSQERNLERELQCRVLSRTGLILDIFAQRARTAEGRLQVELAQLKHLSTRLVRGWTHLERQKGGIGLRGPGETQLETDRRLIAKRIEVLESRLDRIGTRRDLSRRNRRRAEVPTVALVGYTNAGKSALFNRLVADHVYSADQLFATLDPTLRRLRIETVGDVVLADTVGFVRKLPHDLVAAFRATLSEVVEADLLLHVVDASRMDEREHLIEQVDVVVESIGAGDKPQIRVFNKIDLLADDNAHRGPGVDEHGNVWLSALTGEGVSALLRRIRDRLGAGFSEREVTLGVTEGGLRARLIELGAIRSETPLPEGGWRLRVCMSDARWQRLFGASAHGGAPSAAGEPVAGVAGG